MGNFTKRKETQKRIKDKPEIAIDEIKENEEKKKWRQRKGIR